MVTIRELDKAIMIHARINLEGKHFDSTCSKIGKDTLRQIQIKYNNGFLENDPTNLEAFCYRISHTTSTEVTLTLILSIPNKTT